jgi:hypothetical protein
MENLHPRLRPPNGTRQTPPSFHPSLGGNAYDDPTRQMVLEMHLKGQDLDTPDIEELRREWKFPARITCNRWIDLFYETGDICPKRATGNRYSQREILGDVLEKLALFRSVFQKATIAECRAYLFNLDPTLDPYSHSQLHRAEELLGLTRKAASTTADLAYSPINLTKRDNYWQQPPPLGMVGVATEDIIDIDEAGFKLEHQNRRYGKTVAALRCDQPGVYGRGKKLNLLLAISGDNVNVMRWTEVWMDGGTTIERFYDFIRRILDDLAHPRFVGRTFTFTMDNLNSHKNPIILNMIHTAGHQFVFRAPYWPTDGAVEYVFNTVQTRLKVFLNQLTTMDELRNRINLIIGTIPSFHRYFRHVGFPP